VLVPRKNAKSTVGAIIALYMLTEEREPGAEVYSAATTRDQAKIVAEIAWEMARRSPALRDYYGVRVGAKTTRVLEVPGTASRFMPLSSDAHSLDGLNIQCAIVDELHAHETRDVWDVLDTGTGARRQPLLLAITTAGVEIGGICHEKLGYLEKILDGIATDDSFFGINYTIDQGDDYWTEAVARKANPNAGVSVDLDDIALKMREARHSPSTLNSMLTKHFNIWIRSEAGWMTPETWDGCAVAGLNVEQLREFPCWIGVDLGEVRDTSAVVLVFKRGPSDYAIVPNLYLPADAVRHSPIAAMSGWVRSGHLIETSGSEADYSLIRNHLGQWAATLNVQEIDFDRHSARMMMQDLRADFESSMGRDRAELFVVDVPQSIETMDPAMKLTDRLCVARQFQHDGNPCFSWMIGNIVVERNYKDEIYPRKAGGKDSANKIDGPVAMFTALSRARQHVEEPRWTGEVVSA
jgi:phage terminase large subunit-like protein